MVCCTCIVPFSGLWGHIDNNILYWLPHNHQPLKQSVLWNGDCGSNLRSIVCSWISENEQMVIAKVTTNEHQVWIMATQNMKQEPPSVESYWLNRLIYALIEFFLTWEFCRIHRICNIFFVKSKSRTHHLSLERRIWYYRAMKTQRGSLNEAQFMLQLFICFCRMHLHVEKTQIRSQEERKTSFSTHYFIYFKAFKNLPKDNTRTKRREVYRIKCLSV